MIPFHEFGDPQNRIVLLLPPACATFEIWCDYIDRLKDTYRVIAPNYTGHIKGQHYTSIEDNVRRISEHLERLGQEIFLLWGVSEGATMALKLLALNPVPVQYAIADAPYLFEKLTLKDRLTAIKIGASVALLPFMGQKRKAAMLEEQKKEMGERKGQLYYDMMCRLSARSLFREFYSCFTCTMPEDTSHVQTKVGLWYGEKETEKHENAQYLLSRFSNADIQIFKNYSHVEYWLQEVDGYLRNIAEFTSETELAGKQ